MDSGNVANLFIKASTGVERESNEPVLISNKLKHMSVQRQRESLPIYRYKTEILYLIENFQTLILVGGKL
jgi:hypothetical protein